ncbi:MAG: ABC transporter substrate-binding protein [Clostridia bacterium]|nr:ABC transporter substrate-binding protein [Clostridia bacterium]
MKKLITLSLALLMVCALFTAAPADAPDPSTLVPGPKLGDMRVRQALLYALDRENFILAQYGSTDIARVGLAPLSPSSWAFPDLSELNAYAFDLDKAAALLDEAGWTLGEDGYRYNEDGLKLTLSWLVYEDSPWPTTLSAMAYDTWGQIGVDLVIEKMDFNTVSMIAMDAPPFEKDFDIYTMGFSLSAEPDPSGALFDYEAFVEGGFNASGYYNEYAQQLIKDGKSTFDIEERAAIYKEWAKLMNEVVATSIVAYRSEIWGVNERVSGMDIDTYANFVENIRDGEVTLEGDQILKFGETSFKGLFNPIYSDTVYDAYIVDLVFEGMVKVNRQAEYVPHLAEWELSNENRTYTCTLADGIAFSDGVPLTTEDVYFTYMTIADPDYTGPRLYYVSDLEGYAEYTAGEADTISGIEIIDEKTIAFTFAEASPANISNLVAPIMPKHVYDVGSMEGLLALNETPVGSGLFVLDDYQASQYIILSVNENYWDPENAPKIEGIYITEVPDTSKLAALEMGELDFAQLAANVDNAEAIKALPDAELISYLGNGYTYMCFNTLR